MTYVSVIAIFIISGGATTFPMTTLPRRIPRDVRALVSSPIALVLALLFVARRRDGHRGISRPSKTHAAAAPLTPLTDQQRAEIAKWWDVQPKIEPPMPDGRREGDGRDLQRFSVSALSRRARRVQADHREARRRSAGPLRPEAFSARRGVQLVRAQWRPQRRV